MKLIFLRDYSFHPLSCDIGLLPSQPFPHSLTNIYNAKNPLFSPLIHSISHLEHGFSLLHSFSFTTSLFRCVSLISGYSFHPRLLDEAKVDRQGIKDLVNANARKYHNEVDHLTLRTRALKTMKETTQQHSSNSSTTK